ncbi:unnamed protein product, partial [marine sediment metagenome]
ELDKYSHPNARFSLPNFSDNDWKEFLDKWTEEMLKEALAEQQKKILNG